MIVVNGMLFKARFYFEESGWLFAVQWRVGSISGMESGLEGADLSGYPFLE
ncbi:hypothetical protein ACJJIW_19675 [Microbulbifer sp. JMSA004]|uniref:hypothetical protein n=1 Tax=Microbulbifer sp. JMSA004 TaxID=3243370 RepID=UPI0040397BEF